jgi:mono/diheme cytochrome c family protein
MDALEQQRRRAWRRVTKVFVAAIAALAVAGLVDARQASDGWQIPAGAASEASPVPADAAALARGGQIYKSKCQRCHGPRGRGDGSEADPDRPPADLSDPARAARNPDGVLFYKIWNGRRQPKMPAFSSDLSKEEVWTVVHFVKTLRR